VAAFVLLLAELFFPPCAVSRGGVVELGGVRPDPAGGVVAVTESGVLWRGLLPHLAGVHDAGVELSGLFRCCLCRYVGGVFLPPFCGSGGAGGSGGLGSAPSSVGGSGGADGHFAPRGSLDRTSWWILWLVDVETCLCECSGGVLAFLSGGGSVGWGSDFGPRGSVDPASSWVLRQGGEAASASLPWEYLSPPPLCRRADEASIGGAEGGSWSVGGVWLSCRCDSLSEDAGLLLPLRFRSESVVLSEYSDDAVGSRCRRRYVFIDLRSRPASGGSCGVKTFMAGVSVLLRRPVGMLSSPASVCSGDGDVFWCGSVRWPAVPFRCISFLFRGTLCNLMLRKK